MARHSDALLSDLKPQSSSSVSTWLYLIFSALVLGAAERAYRQLAKAKQKRTWELEQRRRHGIPDDDKRPFKIAHRDAAVRARREAEQIEAQAKAQREKEKAEQDAERKRALDQEWEQVNRETGERSRQGMRRRAPVNAARNVESTYMPAPSPQPSATSPSLPGAMPQSPQEEQQSQLQYQPQMRQVGRGAVSSRKRAVVDEEEEDESPGGPSREPQRRKIDVPRGTKRTAEDEDDEEEDNRSVAHRAKIRAGKARQVAAASNASDDEQGSDEDDGPYEPSDKENQPVDEDMTIGSEAETESNEMDQDAPEARTPRQPPQDKGKKRLLSEVDNESVVSGSGGRHKADRKRRKNRDDRLPEGGERFQGSSEGEEQPVTVQRRPSKRQPKATNRPARRTAPPPSTGLQRRDSQIVRKPGDEWTDKAGCKWRWGEDGHKRRNVAVKEIRKRYDMPKDSTHPDANLTMQVLVDKWLTEAEYEQARKDRKLSWQSDEEEEKPTAPVVAESSRGKSLYHLKGSVHPLRASTSMASLVGRVARNVTPLRRSYMTSGSLAGLADSGSSVPSSPAEGSFGLSQSHSRARLVSTPLRGALGSSSTKKPLTEEERKRREAELVRKLTQADKPATPAAPSSAALPVPSASTPSAPSASAPTFSFGASPAGAAAPASAAEPKADSKPPTFSFGAAPAKSESVAPAATSAAPASFSFGARKVEKAEETKPPATFSFGAAASPAASAPAAATPPAGGAPTFSFGGSSTKPAEAAASSTPTAAAPPSFSFGPSSAPAATSPTTTAPSFSFSAASKSPAPAASTPPAAPATFSFGASTAAAPAASAAPSSTAAPTFSFGAASSTPTATTPAATSAPPTFNFGGGGSAPAAAATAPTSAPSFSFGASTPPAAPGASAAPPSFSFGAGGAAPASGGFSFGSGGSTIGSTFSFGKK